MLELVRYLYFFLQFVANILCIFVFFPVFQNELTLQVSD